MRKRIVVQVTICNEETGAVEQNHISVYESEIYSWEVRDMFERLAAQTLTRCGVAHDPQE